MRLLEAVLASAARNALLRDYGARAADSDEPPSEAHELQRHAVAAQRDALEALRRAAPSETPFTMPWRRSWTFWSWEPLHACAPPEPAIGGLHDSVFAFWPRARNGQPAIATISVAMTRSNLSLHTT